MTTFGLALGGGAARGLAHIAMLEAIDELGVKPAVIAGCSMGAVVAAPYASGIPARDIREHALALLADRMTMFKHVIGRKKVKPSQLLTLAGLSSLSVSAERLADIALPDATAKRIEDTLIPLKIITTEFTSREERVLLSGDMHQAVGASIAIPGLIAASRIGDEIFVDGGVTNPVPFDHVRQGVDFAVAIDVTGKSRAHDGRNYSNIEMAVGSLLIMFNQIAQLRRALNPPDIYIAPPVDTFGSVDFFHVRDILAAAEPAKDQLKRAMERHLAG